MVPDGPSAPAAVSRETRGDEPPGPWLKAAALAEPLGAGYGKKNATSGG